MPEFPILPADAGVPLPRMSLRDYARFCERCLRSNSAVTASNCLTQRVDEKDIEVPFRFQKPAVDEVRGASV
jgi:hypothetical protein